MDAFSGADLEDLRQLLKLHKVEMAVFMGINIATYRKLARMDAIPDKYKRAAQSVKRGPDGRLAGPPDPADEALRLYNEGQKVLSSLYRLAKQAQRAPTAPSPLPRNIAGEIACLARVTALSNSWSDASVMGRFAEITAQIAEITAASDYDAPHNARLVEFVGFYRAHGYPALPTNTACKVIFAPVE